MKKLFILMGVIYVLSFISCKESNEKQESFARILRDSAQTQQLLHIADSINLSKHTDENEQPQLGDSDNDSVGYTELQVFRKKDSIHIENNTWPIIKMSVKRIQKIIAKSPDDTLIFYLGTYKDGARMIKYNIRNGTNYKNINEIAGRPSFIIMRKKDINAFVKAQKYYDGASLCPPPNSGGCE